MYVSELLFVEKYRPKNLNDLILPDRVMTKIEGGPKNHLLLHGPAGTGKTSTAKAIVKHFGLDYIYINGSSENGIDIVREKITNFASTLSLSNQGKQKVIIIDEIDGFRAFDSFRATMEKFHKTTRFIATCNYVNKIPEPILSRFDVINFNFDKEDEAELIKKYAKRIYSICKNEELTIEKDALVEFTKRNFPDLRTTLNKLQGFYNERKKVITVQDVKRFNSVYKDVFELVINGTDPNENYKLIASQYGTKTDELLESFGNEFIDYLVEEHPRHEKKIPQLIITVAKYQAQRNEVIDPLISLLACVFELQTIIVS